MAGDWIKVQHVTADKPEVYAMAALLGVTPEDVLGRLIRVWVWADQQSLNGHALSVTDVTLDAVSRRDGFATAMRKVGWLHGENGSVSFPNFDRHNGQTSKKRALATERKVTQRSRSERDKSVTREEKRRVSVSKDTESASPLRGSRLPPDWQPSEELKADASKERPDLHLPTTIASFRDYWVAKPGKDGRKLDWDATFRNWVRNERRPTVPPPDAKPKPNSAAEARDMTGIGSRDEYRKAAMPDNVREALRGFRGIKVVGG